MASGVLVALVGEGTKLAPYLTAADKEYEATIALGTETDTLDAEGKILRHAPIREGVFRESLSLALDVERTRVSQVPPAYSAIHVNGERAHIRARRGEGFVLPPRIVVVKSLECLGTGNDPTPWVRLRLCVGKGYFVRSLARDLADALGTVGHLASLQRMRSGSFTLDDATVGDASLQEMRTRLLPLSVAASRALPVARLTEAGARDARFGRIVRAVDLEAPGTGLFAWLDSNAALVALGEVEPSGDGRVVRGFGS
jgi:tRNA pseudouridine55 synthase